MNIWKYMTSALQGMPRTRSDHRAVLSSEPDIRSGVARLAELTTPATEDPESPIFLFSAGWRSGSTMVQRLLMSDQQLFIWGESYDHCGLVQSLADTSIAFTPDWPPQRYYYDGSAKERLSGRWIADLYPDIEHLRQAHRNFFLTLFAQPAHEAGATRWGLKEVRLGVEHAAYLRWLFPNARFIFLYRNPLDAYRSYCRYGRSWYDRWPNRPVFTPTAFGRHWRNIAQGFVRQADEVSALVVRYEDLVDPGRQQTVVNGMEAFLDVSLDRGVLQNKVGSSTSKGERIWVSRIEKWLLRRAVSPTAPALDYKW